MRTIRCNSLLALLCAVAAAGCRGEAVGSGSTGETTLIPSPDGGVLVADVHRSEGAAMTLLLFHQGGGSARGEYGFLIPTLVDAGYNVVAPDLHGGGDRFGEPNRTLAELPEPPDFSYCDAAPQVGAVRAWAESHFPGTRLVLWGSSYSAALVIREAAVRPDGVAAVLAFSPASGDPMDGCRPDPMAGALTLPTLVLRPANEAEIPSVADQLRAFAEAGHHTWVAAPGAHGSSMLNPARVDGPVEETWQVVSRFLADAAPAGPS